MDTLKLPAGFKLPPAKQMSPDQPPPKQRSTTPPWSVSTSQRKVVPAVPLPPRPPRQYPVVSGAAGSSSAEKRALDGSDGGTSPRGGEETVSRSVSSPSRAMLHPPPPPRDLEQMYLEEAELARVSPTARAKPALRMKTTPVDPPLEEVGLVAYSSSPPPTTTSPAAPATSPTPISSTPTLPLASSGSVSTGVGEWGSGKRGSNAGAGGGGVAGDAPFLPSPPSPSHPKVSPLHLGQDLQSKMQAAAALFSEDDGLGPVLHPGPQIPPSLSDIFTGLDGEIGEGFHGGEQQQQQQQQQQHHMSPSRPQIQQGSGSTTYLIDGSSKGMVEVAHSYTEAPLQFSPSHPPPQILTSDALTASDSAGDGESGNASGNPNASPLETPKPTLVLPNAAEKVAKKAVKAVVAVAMAPGGCCFGWGKKSPLITQPAIPAGGAKKKAEAASNDTTNPFSFKASLRMGRSVKREDGGKAVKVGVDMVEKNGAVAVEAPVPLALAAAAAEVAAAAEEEGRVI